MRRSLAAGLVVLHPDLSELVFEGHLGEMHSLSDEVTQALSSREIEVLQLLALGLSNKAIASRVNISEHTVKFHLGSIFTKLNASGRTEAVTIGLRLGLIWL